MRELSKRTSRELSTVLRARIAENYILEQAYNIHHKNSVEI